MSKQTKFTKEEMAELKVIQDSYIEVQSQLGQLAVSRIRLQSQMESYDRLEGELNNKFVETSNTEQGFVDKITKKYGNGTFDPDSGLFTPNK